MCDVCILGGRKDSYCVYEELKCYCDRCTVDVKWVLKCDMKACPICLVIKFYTTIEILKVVCHLNWIQQQIWCDVKAFPILKLDWEVIIKTNGWYMWLQYNQNEKIVCSYW